MGCTRLKMFGVALIVAAWVPAPGDALRRPTVPPRPVVQTASSGSREALALARQAEMLQTAGRLAEAEAALKQGLAILSTTRADPMQAQALQVLMAGVLERQGRFQEAEALLKAAIASIQGARGVDAETSVAPLMDLAQLYVLQGRLGEAAPLAQRALDLSERYRGRDDPATAELLVLGGNIQASLGEIGKAEPLYRRALGIFQRKPKSSGDEIAVILANLGAIYQQAGQYRDALDMSHQAYMIDLRLFGADHPNTMTALANAATNYERLGQFDDAAGLMARVVDYNQRVFGPDSVQTAHVLNNAGWIELGRKDDARALQFLRPALATYIANRQLQALGPAPHGAVSEPEVSRTILGVLKAARAAADADPSQATNLVNEAFLAAQSVHRGKAATALALTTARLAAGTGELAGLIREQQDTAGRRDQLDQLLTKALAQPAKSRNLQAESDARAAIAQYAARIAAIDTTIQSHFPDYETLADPQPLSVADVQKLLGRDETLVLIVPFGGGNGEGTFTFVIGAGTADWHAAETGTTDMTAMVQTLRCGLDAGAWDGEAGAALCAQLTGSAGPAKGAPLPFAAGTAFQLFDTLFGNLAPSLKGKTLTVVAPDPLGSIPLGVLLTAKPAIDRPAGAQYHALHWLARSNPIAVLPSVAALRGLRRADQARPAPLPYVGFGDPTLLGNRSCARDADLPQTCPSADAPAAMHVALLSRGGGSVGQVSRKDTGQADLDAVRALCPLPETGVELHCVAKSLGVADDVVHVGVQATVPAVLATDLAQYRVVHFATHGLLAGEMESKAGVVAEPALVLTPPATEMVGDDGLLRASAVASLKLNADWVVLSACNTAAGASLGGEAMSGLASAFLYAGARALLVSHWPVQSDAAVMITTAAFGTMKADPGMGRAEALRQAIGKLMDGPDVEMNHPGVWAPFSLVGAPQ